MLLNQIDSFRSTWGSVALFIVLFLTGVSAPNAQVARTEPLPGVSTDRRSGGPVALDYAEPQTRQILVKVRGTTLTTLQQALKSTGIADRASRGVAGTRLEQLMADAEVVAVKRLFGQTPLASGTDALGKQASADPVSQRFPVRALRAPAGLVAPDLNAIFLFQLASDDPSTKARILESLRSDPDVVFAENDAIIRTSYSPYDPLYADGSLYGLDRIGASAAWDTAQGWDAVRQTGVTVAVVDTGIDHHHPDIRNNIWINSGEVAGNDVDDDHNGFVDDVRGWDFVGAVNGESSPDNDPSDGHFHGTHVAGTIAAEGNNGLGMVGVAFRARVMAVKGLDDEGSGSTSALLQAIRYAVDQGADIINASFGGLVSSMVYRDTIDYAVAHGVVFVAAAGNNSTDSRRFGPANVPSAITVSANDGNGNQALFSNRGPKLDVSAPGVDILSLKTGSEGYLFLDGTSMAAPHVSGVVALILGNHPEFTVEQVRQILRTTATDLGPAGKDPAFGYGEVHAARAVLASDPLEARLTLSSEDNPILIKTAVYILAQGPTFLRYVVEMGAGAAPDTWTALATSQIPAAGTQSVMFDPGPLANGEYTIRLRVDSTMGRSYFDQVQVTVRNLALFDPTESEQYQFSSWHKANAPVVIYGRVLGTSLQSYRIEWAPGTNPTAGWSDTGMVLVSSGLSTVLDGPLATWIPDPSLRGDITVRLVVEYPRGSRTVRGHLYLEPDLASSAWPQSLNSTGTHGVTLPMRFSDQSWRLLVPASYTPYLFNSQGTREPVEAIGLFRGDAHAYGVAGNVDALMGDELIHGDYSQLLEIGGPSMALIRSMNFFPNADDFFTNLQRPLVADLDGDGQAEIVSLASFFSRDSFTFTQRGVPRRLFVFRGNGTLYSEHVPVVLQPNEHPSLPEVYLKWSLVTIDLDNNGIQEILVAMPTWSGSIYSYRIKAFNADGTVYGSWNEPEIPGVFSWEVHGDSNPMTVADVDGDGSLEIVFKDLNNFADPRILVFERNGQVRNGWPVTIGTLGVHRIKTFPIAVDMDGDKKVDIVWLEDNAIQVLRHNGVITRTPTELKGLFNNSPLTAADLNHDGVPELLYPTATFQNLDTPYEMRLVALNADGTIFQSWRIFTPEGTVPKELATVIGDFDGDFKTDIVVNMVCQTTDGFYRLATVMAVLGTGLPYSSRVYWPMVDYSPSGNRNLPAEVDFPIPAAAPVITSPSTGVFTNQAMVVVSGTAQAGATVRVYRGNTLMATTNADASGRFSVAVALEAGINTLTATAQNTNPLPSAPSTPVAITLDLVAPVVGPLQLLGVDISSLSSFNGKGIFSLAASDAVSEISRVEFLEGGVVFGSDSDGSDGYNASFDAIAVPAGLRTFSAQAFDRAGNVSSTASTGVVTGNVPNPVITSPASGWTTNQTSIVVVGTAFPGCLVRIFRGEVVLGTTNAAADGTFSFVVPLVAGINVWYLQAVLGPLFLYSAQSVSVILDTTSPVITEPAAVSYTSVTMQTIRGTSPPGTTLMVRISVAAGVTTMAIPESNISADGSFQYSIPLQGQGDNDITVIAINSDGTSRTSNQVTVVYYP